jgi:hypothetical protein
MRLSRPAAVVIIAASAGILAATLRPDFSRATLPWTSCILCGNRGTADAIVNLVLFAPFGVGLALASLRLRTAILAGALLSACVELAQTVIPGRDPSVSDVLFNTLGTGVGWWITRVAPRLAGLPDRAAARLSLVAAVSFAVFVTLTGGLLWPSYPHTVYYGQWTPQLGHLEWYRGRVVDAAVGDLPIRSGRLERSAEVRSALLGADTVFVRAIGGPEPSGLSSLFSIYDEDQREIVLLGPDRDDLVFRYRTAAAILRLDQPDVRFAGAMRDVRSGDSLLVREWRPRPGRVCLARNAAVACDLGFSPGDGWALLYYSESFPGWLKLVLNGGWLALLVALVGFWMRKRAESAVALALVGVGLLILPDLVGLKPASPALCLVALLTLAGTAYVGNRLSGRIVSQRAVSR